MAKALAPKGPLPLVVSPMRRTRETAAALERQWGIAARIEPRVGEIQWLRRIMPGRWAELDLSLRRWRDDVIDALTAISADTVVVTHFVAINATVAAALNDPRVTCFRPDYCSRTVIDVADGNLFLVERGAEAATQVL